MLNRYLCNMCIALPNVSEGCQTTKHSWAPQKLIWGWVSWTICSTQRKGLLLEHTHFPTALERGIYLALATVEYCCIRICPSQGVAVCAPTEGGSHMDKPQWDFPKLFGSMQNTEHTTLLFFNGWLRCKARPCSGLLLATPWPRIQGLSPATDT